jgi:endonuclease/exonuclease/phosphatase family metal-dependent hydrolase
MIAQKTGHSAQAITAGTSRTKGWLKSWPFLNELLLSALTISFGLQVLRLLISGLTWTLGDRIGLGSILLGAIALAVFLLAFLSGGLLRLLGYRRTIIITAGGLGLFQLVIQLWYGEPLVTLGLAMAGTAFFVLFLPVYLQNVRLQGKTALGHFALGLIIGLILDTTVHGAFATYDLVWQPGLAPLLVILAMVLLQWLLLATRQTDKDTDRLKTAGSFGRESMAWFAIGPFLFLQLVVLQNIARLSALTGWPTAFAFGWILVTQLAGLSTAIWLLKKDVSNQWLLALLYGIALIVSLAAPHPQSWLAAVSLLGGQIFLTLLLVMVLVSTSHKTPSPSFFGITIGNGLGMILLGIFLLGYYAVYQISLPFSNTVLVPIAALIVAITALMSSTRLRHGLDLHHRAWLAPGLSALLLILPLVGIIIRQPSEAIPGNNFPVRIMAYNLHNGFNTDGRLNMEALALVIEESQPDIVALQEVSRGWLVSGRLDMLNWLSQRLEMPFVWGPTADPFWGNAILSRYPIIEGTNHELPSPDLPLDRGFTRALIDFGGSGNLQVIATHFHHTKEGSAIRQLQAQAIFDFWYGAANTVILGDLNAQPDDPEIQVLQQAGLIDAMFGIDSPPDTYPSYNPSVRIDYIWVSSDLKVTEVQVPSSNASDHLPVVATIVR